MYILYFRQNKFWVKSIETHEDIFSMSKKKTTLKHQNLKNDKNCKNTADE